MKKDNVSSKKRNIFLTQNKYQEQIIQLTFYPAVLTFFIFIITISVTHPFVKKVIFHNSFDGMNRLLSLYSWMMVFAVGVALFLSIIFSFIVSHYLVGAFQRIIKELDDVIAGRSQKTITCRPGDHLAKELLKRVNVLIDFYVKNKK
jgi:type II secretory pathway component PulF